MKLLEIKELKKSYAIDRGLFKPKRVIHKKRLETVDENIDYLSFPKELR
ncbi:hypothetical protein ACOWNJ_02890 [Helicobacter pylori]